MASVRPGHSYDRVQVTDYARMHMGDCTREQTIINHNYLGFFAAMEMRLSQSAEASEKVAIVRLAASIIAAVILDVLVQILLLFQRLLYCAIPQPIRRRVPVLLNLLVTHDVFFEDALGRFDRIDLNVVADWTTFHYKLTCSFINKPGYRRVAVAGYRLFDRTRSEYLIDPKRPPPFTSIFRANKHLRMSIHFERSEVSLECCPKCGIRQLCESDTETTCRNARCGFHYRGQVEDYAIETAHDAVDQDRCDGNEQHGNARKKLLKEAEENLARFKRISVSKQPTVRPTLHPDAATTSPKPLQTGIKFMYSSIKARQGRVINAVQQASLNMIDLLVYSLILSKIELTWRDFGYAPTRVVFEMTDSSGHSVRKTISIATCKGIYRIARFTLVPS
jgi:hypothetical protein